MEEKEKNFFQKVWTSIRDFEGYEEFAAESISKSIIYLLLINLIFVIIITIGYTYKLGQGVQEVKSYINENISEISMADGELKVQSDEEIIIENENSVVPIIIVNTSENANQNSYEAKLKGYDVGILLLSDKMVFSSSVLQEPQSISYSELLDEDIENKEELLNAISTRNIMQYYLIFGGTLAIYLYVLYFMSSLIDAIVLSVLGYLIARFLKIRLKYKATFNIGIHSLTLSIILNLIYILVNTFTGFEIKYFQWMYTSISYIYVVVAILMIKTEIINQKIQLVRLRQIQEKEAREAEEAEKEEKQEDKKEEKQDENKQEEQEKEKKSETSGEEPEGSNA